MMGGCAHLWTRMCLCGRHKKQDTRTLGRIAFDAGVESFLERNFRFGDPADYFHPPGHPHHSKPDFSGLCEQCVPPVHGKVVFLWCKDPENEPEKIEYVYATNPEPAQPPTSKLSRLSQLAASRRFSTHRTSQQTPRSDSKRRTSLRRTSQQQESTSNTPQQSHRKRGDSSLSASAVTVVSATDERPSALAESSA